MLRKLMEVIERHKRPVVHYSVSGNGVAYRKASDYLNDKKVEEQLKKYQELTFSDEK